MVPFTVTLRLTASPTFYIGGRRDFRQGFPFFLHGSLSWSCCELALCSRPLQWAPTHCGGASVASAATPCSPLIPCLPLVPLSLFQVASLPAATVSGNPALYMEAGFCWALLSPGCRISRTHNYPILIMKPNFCLLGHVQSMGNAYISLAHQTVEVQASLKGSPGLEQ